MPAFNAGMFVSDAIDSILKQTFRFWELIIVDDGSTDLSPFIFKRYQNMDSRIRVLGVKHMGISMALNHGVSYAKSSLIARMDADDIAHPSRFEKQYQYLMKHPSVGVLATQVSVFSENMRGDGLIEYVKWSNSLCEHESIINMRFVDAPIIHPSVCIRRELFDKYGGYTHEDFPEDYEMWLRLMDCGIEFSKIEESLLNWRDHESKLTRTHRRYREDALWKLKGEYFIRWYRDHIKSSRPLLIWGAGRKSRSRLKYFDIINQIQAFIDIDSRKIGQMVDGVPVVNPAHISTFEHPFIIGMVGSRGARGKISQYLNNIGKSIGDDYTFVA